VLDERSHTAHVYIKIAHEDKVISEMAHSLIGQAHHHSRACLVTLFLDDLQAFEPSLVPVHLIVRVHFAVKSLAGGLDAEQVAVGSRLKPAAICLPALLTQGEGDPQSSAGEPDDAPDQLFNVINECPGSVLPRLYGYGAKVETVGGHRRLYHLLIGHGVPLNSVIVTPDTAVKTVFPAHVRILDQPSEIDIIAQIAVSH